MLFMYSRKTEAAIPLNIHLLLPNVIFLGSRVYRFRILFVLVEFDNNLELMFLFHMMYSIIVYCVIQLLYYWKSMVMPAQEFDRLAAFIKRNYNTTMDKVDVSLKGWNWGSCIFKGTVCTVEGKICNFGNLPQKIHE